jgi:putative NADH-flavin reductase
LNKVVGGAPSSQHVKGEAADIRSVQDTPEENRKLYDLIVKLKLPFDQLINEHGFDWVHVSFGARHRRQQLRAVWKNGKTIYI